jgi:enoyl-CoA hydratase/carnithine racemase
VIGWARASELALTGEPITADKALAWGMVSEVYEDESLLTEAWKLAERIAANPRQALRSTKKLLREGMMSDLNSHLDKCALIQAQAHHSADHKEAVQAILEKRMPDFRRKK